MAAKPMNKKKLKKLGQRMKTALSRINRRQEIARGVILRQAEIERIDRQWAESGGSPLPSGKGKGIKKPDKDSERKKAIMQELTKTNLLRQGDKKGTKTQRDIKKLRQKWKKLLTEKQGAKKPH